MAQVIFNATGTWTCPAGITTVLVECWAGGAPGQDLGGFSGGIGGGAGAYAAKVLTVVPTTQYAITVSAVTLNGGGSGGDSSFETDVVAKGGNEDGSGGTAADSTGDVKFSGGDGGVVSGAFQGGAGGGGSASSNANGGNGQASDAGRAGGISGGGIGGSGGASTGINGTAGTTPGGGGGGGGGLGGDGGSGAAGLVVITYAITNVLPGTGALGSLIGTSSYMKGSLIG